jgi:catechol 2,3-dioxygenase-like lactoylglutathione lyase family enzyme
MGLGLGRVGHVGIHVTDLDQSIDWYRRVVGLKVTGRWGPPDFGVGVCFMRIDEMHHNIVLFETLKTVDKSTLDRTDSAKRKIGGLHHIAFEVPEREDWLNAIEHVRSCGVEIVAGPYVHGHEAEDGKGFLGGSGSHAFYFCDPDGNRIELYCWMMNISKSSASAPEPDL